MLLWHMADRWGVMRGGQVLVPIQLPHSVLAEVLAARRPTVTTALGALQHAGKVTHTDDGWILHGPPPGELSEIAAAPEAEPPIRSADAY
jgi:CRP-like cAMP-binding protein